MENQLQNQDDSTNITTVDQNEIQKPTKRRGRPARLDPTTTIRIGKRNLNILKGYGKGTMDTTISWLHGKISSQGMTIATLEKENRRLTEELYAAQDTTGLLGSSPQPLQEQREPKHPTENHNSHEPEQQDRD